MSTGWKILPQSLFYKNISTNRLQTLKLPSNSVKLLPSLVTEKPDLCPSHTSYNDPFLILSKFSRLTLYSTSGSVWWYVTEEESGHRSCKYARSLPRVSVWAANARGLIEPRLAWLTREDEVSGLYIVPALFRWLARCQRIVAGPTFVHLRHLRLCLSLDYVCPPGKSSSSSS